MIMNKALLFNEDELNYDKYRPAYPKEVYDEIFSYALLHENSQLLEIGIGTGQATEPFLKAGCKVTAAEIGDKLSAFVGRKYRDYGNFQVINSDFMTGSFKPSEYDLIYSATAFHWLPMPEKYEKAQGLLKPGGTLALFWNRPFVNRANDETNTASKSVYDKYRPSDKKQAEFNEKDCHKIANELKESGFVNVKSKLFHRIRVLSADEYICLINTYSDHRMLSADIRKHFETDMRNAINSVGGKINIYDTVDLYLAQKA